jgi:hypothetical protein
VLERVMRIEPTTFSLGSYKLPRQISDLLVKLVQSHLNKFNAMDAVCKTISVPQPHLSSPQAARTAPLPDITPLELISVQRRL